MVFPGRIRRLGVGLAAVLSALWVLAANPVPAVALVIDNLVVIDDDGEVLEPAQPIPFAGQQIAFDRDGSGYLSSVGEPVAPAGPGRLVIPAGSSLNRAQVSLNEPVPFFGREHREIFVYAQGVVSFGEPLAPEASAQAADSSRMINELLYGPPVAAALWNELRLDRASVEGAGVYVAEFADRVVVTWLDLPSVRPAGETNQFRAVFHRSGRVEFQYPKLATKWGVIGITPGGGAGTDLIDLALEPVVEPMRGLLAWYRDRPRLNEIALARRVYREVPDRFDFLAVFTDQVVEDPRLVGSITVANRDHGIGMRVFDHARLFGSRKLEHIVLMNSLSFYDEDPLRSPRIPDHAQFPSTLAVLSHEMGHRWLASANQPLTAPDGSGHWNFFLDTDGSFMGGSQLTDNADGTFTTREVMTRFGPVDQYLMGLRGAEEVKDFFLVEDATGVDEITSDAPVSGVTFSGQRRDLSVDDLIEQLGQRYPQPAERREFRMGFVFVVEQGSSPSRRALEKLQKIRRSFGPFFRQATDGRALVRSWIPDGARLSVFPSSPSLPEQPFILQTVFGPQGEGRGLLANIDFLDTGGDVVELELSTDVSAELPPARVDLVSTAFGERRGRISFHLATIPPEASELRLTLVDADGRRSETKSLALPRGMAST